MRSGTSDQYRVYLHERPIGHLLRHDDYTRFVFDDEYKQDPHRAVLGLRFEEDLDGRYAANMRLPAWFSNLLPEGRLREWIGETRGVPVEREMELLAQVGHDLPGAVRVLPSNEPLQSKLLELNGHGDDATARRKEVRVAMWRFSLAGVGLKFSMLANGDRFVAPASGGSGDWIVKLPDAKYPDVPSNEMAMMTLASSLGIDTPEVRLVHRDEIESLPERLWPINETYAYAVRRFDRGEGRTLVHMEDLAQVRGFYPEEKYAGTFETIAALIYRRRDLRSLLQFVKRLAFNILIGNGDAHLKNWSLLYHDPRRPSLSPAYDLVSTAVYRQVEDGPENLGLRFGGSRQFGKVRLSDFSALGTQLNAQADLSDVAAELCRQILPEWSRVEPILHSSSTLRDGIKQHIMSGVHTLLGSK